VLKRTMHLIPRRINRHALAEAERWTRARMQGDGGIGAIYPAMANAVMALKTLGYGDDDPDYRRGLEAIDNLMTHPGAQTLGVPAEGNGGGAFSSSSPPRISIRPPGAIRHGADRTASVSPAIHRCGTPA